MCPSLPLFILECLFGFLLNVSSVFSNVYCYQFSVMWFLLCFVSYVPIVTIVHSWVSLRFIASNFPWSNDMLSCISNYYIQTSYLLFILYVYWFVKYRTTLIMKNSEKRSNNSFLYFICNVPFFQTIHTVQYIYTTRHYTHYIDICSDPNIYIYILFHMKWSELQIIV